jgi:hypothetical protein
VARIREGPGVLWAFAVAWLGWFALTALLYGGDAPFRTFAGAFVVMAVAAFFLLRGSRVAWALLVLTNGAAALSLLHRDIPWGFFHLALLAALFAPEARRYVWHGSQRLND